MAASAQALVSDSMDDLHEVILDALHEQVVAGLISVGDDGCQRYESGTGRVKWMGGVFAAKRVLFEHAKGSVPSGSVLRQTCSTFGCVAAGCHVVQSRREWGHQLGIAYGQPRIR